MKKMKWTTATLVICLFGSISAHAASGCSNIAELDRKTRYTSMYDTKTQQALADIRQGAINDFVAAFEPAVQELVRYSPKFAEYFNGSLGSPNRKQMVENLFSVCASHIDYETGDALRVVISNLAAQLGVQ